MMVYVVSYNWGYDGGSTPVMVFYNEKDAQRMVNSMPYSESSCYSYEEVEIQ